MRYNPVELDPEEMCRMASEEPQVNKIKRMQPSAVIKILHKT